MRMDESRYPQRMQESVMPGTRVKGRPRKSMESLVEVINKLQMVQSTVGQQDFKFHLPQIVIIGSQSAGKSSVLEAIVGHSFLPRGEGMVTRCPLALQLIHTVDQQGPNGCKTWAEFHHCEELFTDFEKIRREIANETERMTDGKLSVTEQEIVLRIFSPDLPTLTLVDLPGFTTVALPNQPADLPAQINALVYKYISNPNSLIVAVTAANTDLATSESFNAAKKVDLSGDRTLAVITKLDIMNPGTDAMDILTGKVLPFKLGIVGVVNQSQKDIKNRVSLSDTRLKESEFLKAHYRSLASQNGTPYLTKLLSELLMKQIQTCFPDLRGRILDSINESEKRLDQLAHIMPEDQETMAKVLVSIINKFVCTYKSCIEDPEANFSRSKACGGARIFMIFNEDFHHSLRDLDTLEGISEDDLMTAIKKAQLPSQSMFACEKAFQMLVKHQIQLLLKPSLLCVQMVYSEMEDVVHTCLSKISSDTQCFPNVPSMILATLKKLLKDTYDKTCHAVQTVMKSQRTYINVWHPDFIELVMEKVNNSQDTSICIPKEKYLNGLLFSSLSHMEQNICNITKILIQSYMSIVTRDVKDFVPKLIMTMLVEATLEKLYSELMLQLYTSDLGEKALKVSEDLIDIRKNAKEALDAHNTAYKVLEGILTNHESVEN